MSYFFFLLLHLIGLQKSLNKSDFETEGPDTRRMVEELGPLGLIMTSTSASPNA